MKTQTVNKNIYIIGAAGAILLILPFFFNSILVHLGMSEKLSSSAQAAYALKLSAFDANSVWNQDYFAKHTQLKKKLEQYEAGTLCISLKTLDNKNQSYEVLTSRLKAMGYDYSRIPMTVSHSGPNKQFYLKKDGKKTRDLHNADVVHQEIFKNSEGCTVRFKKEGFPNNVRPYPHSTKAVLLNPKKGPTYDNEAFQITWDGKPVPKGPKSEFGLKMSFTQGNAADFIWIDSIMEQSHPALFALEPLTPMGSLIELEEKLDED